MGQSKAAFQSSTTRAAKQPGTTSVLVSRRFAPGFDARGRAGLTYRVSFSFFCRFWPVFLWLVGGFFPVFSARAQDGSSERTGPRDFGADFQIPRAGAPRALRFIDAAGVALQGSFSGAQWEARGGGLFFTRQVSGERNVWRAFPDAQDKARYATWRALPVTAFRAPAQAFGATALPGGRAILMISNALDPRRAPQATRLDLRSGALSALTNFEGGVFDVAASPDGETMAFSAAATRGGAPAVWVQNLNGGAPRRVALNARRPIWQNSATLLLESLVNATVFQLFLDDASRPTPLVRGSQISAAQGGRLLSVCAGKNAGDSQLYLLAGDGSGLRVLAGTEGAQNPALASDGRTLSFDAPLSQGDARALWVLPLEREKPRENEEPDENEVEKPQVQGNARLTNDAQTRVGAPWVQISGTRVTANGELAILGTIAGENTGATLEFGEGMAPTRWTATPVAVPLSSETPLALWTPPAGARGNWSLRLTVSNPGGAARSLISVRLPLVPIPVPVAVPATAILPPGGPLPRPPLPDLPLAPSFLPKLPPLPSPAPRPTATPTPRPTPATVPTLKPPTPPTPLPPAAPPVSAPPSQDLGRDAATFNISGTFATMAPGQTMRLTFWALNRGARVWEAGKIGQTGGAVRLVARWVDFESGNRRKWTLQWMKTPVLPGNRTSWSFDLAAPTRPGRYKLIYGLVRVPGENWTPPAYNARQETWPNEFSAIAFAVTVK